MPQTIAEINAKITKKTAKVLTVTELKRLVAEVGVKQATKQVDVITTGTFEPMESSGAIINLGHTDPPIKIRSCWIDGVSAYAGFGAVDLYLGATQEAELGEDEKKIDRGGGHVIADLIAGKSLSLRAIGNPNDCYPRTSFESTITKDSINQFYLFNPRNLYQNFIVGVNSGEDTLFSYLGPLQPRLGNAVYSNPGAISPLWNDPDLQSIGIGTKIFMGGGIGYVAWEGTQHFPLQKRLPNHTPVGPAATLALIGDAKQMDAKWVKGCYFHNYGASLMLGVGVPLPVTNEEVVARAAVMDADIVAPVIDFSIPRRVRPTFGSVSYAQLKSGKITVGGKTIRTAPLASIFLSEQVAQTLKEWIMAGEFTLTEPVALLPSDRAFIPQDIRGF
jgi:L-aspartate semialdehyde sulfurtransferase